MWELVDGIRHIRRLQEILQPIGFHCALAGGVLLKGYSDKDLDIIIYPHEKGKVSSDVAWKKIQEILQPSIDKDKIFECDKDKNGDYPRDGKDVKTITKDGKRYDFFFLD